MALNSYGSTHAVLIEGFQRLGLLGALPHCLFVFFFLFFYSDGDDVAPSHFLETKPKQLALCNASQQGQSCAVRFLYLFSPEESLLFLKEVV